VSATEGETPVAEPGETEKAEPIEDTAPDESADDVWLALYAAGCASMVPIL
jgi:hypothetical protein